MIDTRTDVCPIHPTAQAHCPCTRSEVLQTDVLEPAAVGLWECSAGHRTVGPPTLRVGNRVGAVCQPGCRVVRRVAVAVIPPRGTEGARL